MSVPVCVSVPKIRRGKNQVAEAACLLENTAEDNSQEFLFGPPEVREERTF